MKVLILETTGDWAAALRREVSPRVAIVETRSLEELLGELGQSPAAVAAIEIAESRIDRTITVVAQTARRYPSAVIVAAADRKLGRYEPILREAGAAHVVFSTRQTTEIAAIANQRLAAEPENDFNAEDRSLEEQIWAQLPWSS